MDRTRVSGEGQAICEWLVSNLHWPIKERLNGRCVAFCPCATGTFTSVYKTELREYHKRYINDNSVGRGPLGDCGPQ